MSDSHQPFPKPSSFTRFSYQILQTNHNFLTISPQPKLSAHISSIFHYLVTHHLAVALTTNGHTAPIAWTSRVAPSLQMGALHHINGVVSWILDQAARSKGDVGSGWGWVGMGTGDGEDAEEWKGEGGELHD